MLCGDESSRRGASLLLRSYEGGAGEGLLSQRDTNIFLRLLNTSDADAQQWALRTGTSLVYSAQCALRDGGNNPVVIGQLGQLLQAGRDAEANRC
jgi:hypothetical protein